MPSHAPPALGLGRHPHAFLGFPAADHSAGDDPVSEALPEHRRLVHRVDLHGARVADGVPFCRIRDAEALLLLGGALLQ
eukprot:1516062-Lingulodinium_polyedra.AAC.1